MRPSPLWEQGHELAGHIIGNWAERYGGHGESPGSAARLLTALTRLADTESIAAFLARLAEGGGFGKGDTGALVEAAGLLAPEQAATLIERIIRAKASSSLEACAALLARAATGPGRSVPVPALRERPRLCSRPFQAIWLKRIHNIPGGAGLGPRRPASWPMS